MGRWIPIPGAALACALVLVAGTACGPDDEEVAVDDADVPTTLTVTSTALEDGGTVPVRFTCDGDEVSPPLRWGGVPADAAALALVVDDPDAPRGTFTHWVLLDLPASTSSLTEGEVPEGAVQATTSAGTAAYAAPCPPSGTHRYRFTVYALDEATGLGEGAPLDEALTAVADHAVARGRLVATYSR